MRWFQSGEDELKWVLRLQGVSFALLLVLMAEHCYKGLHADDMKSCQVF